MVRSATDGMIFGGGTLSNPSYYFVGFCTVIKRLGYPFRDIQTIDEILIKFTFAYALL
jgi:hypothetical protein